jgi:biopolymer transport protein ExbB
MPVPTMNLMFDLPAVLAQSEPASVPLISYVTKGGAVGYVLVVLSFVAIALIVANMIQLRMSRLAPDDVTLGLEERLRVHDIEGAIAFCRVPENDCFLTRMFAAGLTRCSRSAFGFLELKSALEEAGQRQVDRLTKLTDGVGLVAAVGPMLGLLGTVFGMVNAFRTISELEGAARSNELTKYMEHALVTTALGLLVAIPCTVAFTMFKRRIDRLAGEIGQKAEELAGFVQGKGVSARPQTHAQRAVAGTVGPRAVSGVAAVGGPQA